MTLVETTSTNEATVGPAPQAPSGALLLGADYRSLGMARSLGRHGVPVWVLREPSEPLASYSRFVRRSLHWPAAEAEERVDFLCELAAKSRIAGWALIPTSDEAAALVARHHDRLGRVFTHTVPSWDVVRWAYDKRLTYKLAEQLGVAYPRTVYPATRDDLSDANVGFPAVIKPAVKESFNRLTAAKAWRVDTFDELVARYAEACTLVDPDTLMIQELIFGGGEDQFSYAALCAAGEPLASVTARRTRQYPADFGRASTYVETVDCPEIVEPSLRLLREIRFDGLIEIEYKRDPGDGVLKLLDINPRVWGWQSLCGRAGVDFPYLQWLQISGETVPETSARPGVGWLRFMTDTPTALKELVGGRLPLREYLRSLRGPKESAIFAWDDPLPGLVELPVLVFLLAQRLRAGDAV